MEKALHWPGGTVQTGGRQHRRRKHHKGSIPKSAADAHVGLLRDFGGEIKIVPADADSVERQKVLVENIVKRIHRLDRFILSLPNPD